MDWYSGGVAEAIASSRKNKALFIVYVCDDSDASSETTTAWSTPEVQSVLSSHRYVALKLNKGTVVLQQFSQLFPVLIFPTVFCIGLTGDVLAVVNGATDSTQLTSSLTEAFNKHENKGTSPEATPSQAPPLTVTTPTVSVDDDTDGADQQPSLDEKVERAKDLIKQRRVEKEEQQFEKERSDELKRRDMGREAAKVKKMREERHNQDWIKERQKQKDDAKRAREEVRAKLEQDKLEREARAAAAKRERSAASATTIPTVMSSVSTSGMCRIQLKLPEGGSSVVEVNRTDTLATLRDRVAQEVGMTTDSIALTRVYPRQELGSDSDDQTMIQLQLVPSGVVLVRTAKSFVSGLKRETGGGLWGALTWLFQLIVWFLTFIKDALAGLFGGGASQQGSEDSSRTAADMRRERLSALGGDNAGGPRGSAGGPRLRKFRQEDYLDDEDERRQTYNGNSTQQQ